MEQNLQQQHALKVQELVDSAFGKGLASVIICGLPISSIVAIFLAVSSKKSSKEAINLGIAYNIEVSGKNIAAKVLNTIGLISGIVATAIWGLYLLLIFLIAIMSAL